LHHADPIATGEQAHYILERLANLSKPSGTTIAITGETAQIQLTKR
jgi:hypothetical protein